MNILESPQLDCSEFVELDPTGRYGRYNEILGKGASKTVYKAFDEYEGIEVAWNQVKLYDFLQSPEDLERLYCEIHLLKTLKHENIMKFYTSWVDTTNRNINFVTEMFTSGTLRQFRLKHRRVNIRAVKHWCRQILKGLHYLHSHDPPVIHRDLKCDNIFVNGNQGEVKIGDLGLAAILKKSHAVRIVGTPEFMAPEVYEEEYNELVDIYSFGMCVLEMVTFEYPYSECNHPAQIYKKVISGRKPDALFRVKDPEVREFVDKCLATVSRRLSAVELLNDPFLQNDDYTSDLRMIDYGDFKGCSMNNGFANCLSYYPESLVHPVEYEATELELIPFQDDEHSDDMDITIKGRRKEDEGIFLRLRIADKEGRIRNIYFPFDIETDTALSVATEMVAELDITDQDVWKIADMIDGEIATLVPEWKAAASFQEEIQQSAPASLCQNCASNGYLLDYVSSKSQSTKNVQVLRCSKDGCTSVHGRFEEITYQVDGPEQCEGKDCEPVTTGQGNGNNYTDIWAQRDMPEVSSQGSKVIPCDEGHDETNVLVDEHEEKIVYADTPSVSNARNSVSSNCSEVSAHLDDYENEIRRELRWLKAKYQMQIREFKNQQLGVKPKPLSLNQDLDINGVYMKSNCSRLPSLLPKVKKGKNEGAGKPGLPTSRHIRCLSTDDEERRLVQMLSAKNFCKETPLLPHSLNRATSLPVDAVDV